MESVRLRSSELISCEWCNVKKLPVLFLQTKDEECRRLRDQLEMCQDREGEWYDCEGNSEYRVTYRIQMRRIDCVSQMTVMAVIFFLLLSF